MVIVANIAFGRTIKQSPQKIPEVTEVANEPEPNPGVGPGSSDQTRDNIKKLIEFTVNNSTIAPALMKSKIEELKQNLYGEEEIK